MRKKQADAQALVTPKRRPMRADSRQTEADILRAAATLLEEVGFERLSTNMICDQAGLTPPALYRYFPNKYAVLFELSHNWLIEQQRALDTWIQGGGLGGPRPEEWPARLNILLDTMIAVARRVRAALWIERSLRSVPGLQDVRTIAQQAKLRAIEGVLERETALGGASDRAAAARLVAELLTTAIELTLTPGSEDPATLRDAVVRALVGALDAPSGERDG